jgi:hypothetical protein
MVVASRLALLAVPVVALALGGCASPAPTSTSAPTALYPTATPTPTASAAPSAGTMNPSAPAGQCADAVLEVDVVRDPAGGAAGSVGYLVEFTNTGTESCTLQGQPGVSVVGHGDGTQLGPAAEREGGTGASVELAPGGLATAALRAVAIGTDGGPLPDCDVVGGDGWRVYPPHSYRAWFVPDATITACEDGPAWLHVGVAQSAD